MKSQRPGKGEGGRAVGFNAQVLEVSVRATDAENADRSLETLGLAPDLSSLSREVVDLIRHGSHDRRLGCSEVIVAVCVELLRADYGVAEIWMILTDPNNGISEAFFSKDGKQAEAWLEWIVSEAHEALNRRERDKSGVDLALGTHGDGYRI